MRRKFIGMNSHFRAYLGIPRSDYIGSTTTLFTKARGYTVNGPQ